MTIKELTKEEFNQFASNHILKNFYQSSCYGDVMSRFVYNSIYIGGFKDDKLVVASLILTKSIAPTIKYGYAPRGFLIDFYNYKLLEDFTQSLKSFLFKKGICFVKINPEVTYSLVDANNNTKAINQKSKELIDILVSMDYYKLKDNLYFEAVLPKYNPIINLQTFDIEDLTSKVKTRIKNTIKKGQKILEGRDYNISNLYEFIKGKKDRPIEYYKEYYKVFSKKDMIDYLLVEVDFNEYLQAVKEEIEEEEEKNNILNQRFAENTKNKANYNLKMESDKRLNSLKQEIIELNLTLQKGILKKIIAAAFVIKYENRVSILISGYDINYKYLNPNYYLHYEIIRKYQKEGYKFLDLNGITGDFSENNPYKGLNEFKLNFNPKIYEYIGEFDLIINKPIYQLLLSSNKLEKEFKRKDILTIEK